MTKQLIVGTFDTDNIHKQYPDANRLGGGILSTIRQAANDLGLPQRLAGREMVFYGVDTDKPIQNKDESLFQVISGTYCKVVMSLDRADLKSAIAEVNARYTQRMDNATHAKYKKDLRAAIAKICTKHEEITKEDKPQGRNWNNLKVGDIILCSLGRGARTNGIVTKITDAGFTYVKWVPTREAYFINKHRAVMNGQDEMYGRFEIPISGNEHFFKMSKVKSERWNKKESHLSTQTPLNPGDCFYNEYHADWDHMN